MVLNLGLLSNAATIKGLEMLKDPHEEAAMRGVDVEKVIPFWDR